jgi:hypothetical protein
MAAKRLVPEHTDATITAEVSQGEASAVTGLFQYKKKNLLRSRHRTLEQLDTSYER